MNWDWKKVLGAIEILVFIMVLRWFNDEPKLTAMQASLIAIFGAVITRPSQKSMWQTFKDWRNKIAEDVYKKHAKKDESGS